MTKETGPRQQAAMAFARLIAERIARALQEGRCSEYAIVAAPRFLGMLRTALAGNVKVEPWLTIDKAMVGRDTATIDKLLKDHMP